MTFPGRVATVLYPLFAPLLVAARLLGAGRDVRRDAERWCRRLDRWGSLPEGSMARWSNLLAKPEFRGVVLHRMRSRGPAGWLVAKIFGLFYRGPVGFYLDCPDVGPGLYLEHAFATIVTADRIGEDVWINQQVTVGRGSTGSRPTIGDRVAIRAGAIVIGGLRVGNDSVIGAGAVVTHDVPPNSLAVGVPARSTPIATT